MIQNPARNSFASAKGPSVTSGVRSALARTMRAWSGSASFPVTRAAFDVNLTSNRWVYAPGDKIDVRMNCQETNGTPAIGVQVELKAELVDNLGKTTVKFKVVCGQPCDVTAELTVDRPTARKLGLGKKLVAGTLSQTGIPAGRTELTLKLKSKAKKALQKGPKTASYRARIKAKGNYAGTPPVSRSAQVTLKP